MALNPGTLAAQLTALTTEGKNQEALTLEFAQIITDYIKTATVTGTATGANGGGPMTSTVVGNLQ